MMELQSPFDEPLMVRTNIMITISQGSLQQPLTISITLDNLVPFSGFLAALRNATLQRKIQLCSQDSAFETPAEAIDQVASSADVTTSGKRSLVELITVTPDNNVDLPNLISKVVAALELGIRPELCEEGVNGTYFLKDKDGETIAVFKPDDEEGDSTGNPKLQKKGDDDDDSGPVRKGILPGEAAVREVAAFLLDKSGFFSVPATGLVKIPSSFFSNNGDNNTTKQGSLQKFVENDGAAGDISPHLFPAREVHKIGILDIQILNNDRHEGNILYRKTGDSYHLIPIDHGYSLPHALDGAWFDWMFWPQAKKPFDAETLAYVASIDVDQDAATLRGLGIRSECVRTMKLTTTLLKKAAAAGLCLFDIASMVCRKDLDSPSHLELICQQALGQLSLTGDITEHNEVEFLEMAFSLMDQAIEIKLSRN